MDSQWEINLFAKGTRKKLAIKRGKIVQKVLVVHDRKYRIFLASGAGSEKVVGGGRKRVQKSENNRNGFFIFLGTLGSLENFCRSLSNRFGQDRELPEFLFVLALVAVEFVNLQRLDPNSDRDTKPIIF